MNHASTPPIQLRTPRRSEREEMLAGHLYDASDQELNSIRQRSGELCAQFNASARTDQRTRSQVLDDLLPHRGEKTEIMGPIFFDYGINTTIGNRTFINFNFTVLDCCLVTIGDDVLIGPNVSLLPPMHPLRWQDRNIRIKSDGIPYDYEYAKPITIGSNCWLAGNVTIIGGVIIGEGSVIGAGSVVTRDIEPNSLAVGNPARIIRKITDENASCLQDYQ